MGSAAHRAKQQGQLQKECGEEEIRFMKALRRKEMNDGMMVALLRGINVGGTNKLPMKALAAIFEAAACTGVKTYIQSGNVVFCADKDVDVAGVVKREIEKQLGLKVPVVLRTAAEIQRALKSNPFVKKGIDEDWLHVMFLEAEPTKAQVAALDAARGASLTGVPDEFVVIGREVYLHLPNGAAKTKLTNAYFDSKLKTVGTQRNWRTVGMLAEMME